MPTKKKVEFHLGAAIYTIITRPFLMAHLKSKGYADSIEGLKDALKIGAESNDMLTGKMKLDIRRTFRELIENNETQLSFYLEKKKELEKPKDKNDKFAITIKGAGTKEDIVRELQDWITTIKVTTLEKLREGVEHEEPNTILTTDLPETYY